MDSFEIKKVQRCLNYLVNLRNKLKKSNEDKLVELSTSLNDGLTILTEDFSDFLEKYKLKYNDLL